MLSCTKTPLLPKTFSIKEISSEDLPKYDALLKKTFMLQNSFFHDFPILKASQKHGIYKLGIFKKDTSLLAGASGRVCQLKIPLPKSSFTLWPIFLIGGVATDPSFQKRGFGSLLIHSLLQIAQKQKALLAVLWSDQVAFYKKFSFYPSGMEYRVPLSKLPLAELPKKHSYLLKEGFDKKLFPLFQKRTSGLKRTEKDASWITEHKNTQWFLLWDATQTKILSFCAYRRGIDLPNHIHEWGGDPKSLFLLLNLLKNRFPKAVLLSSSFLWKSYFQDPPDPSTLFPLAFFKILHLKELKQKLLRLNLPLPLSTPAPGIFSPELPLWFWGLDAI